MKRLPTCLLLVVTLAMTGCLWAKPPDSSPSARPAPDTIQMEKRGGFGALESEKITLKATDAGAKAEVVQKKYDSPPEHALKGELSAASWGSLWNKLEQQRVLELKDDLSLEGKVTDLYTYDLKFTRKGIRSAFRVYGPEQLTSDTRYAPIVRAIHSAVAHLLGKEQSPSPSAEPVGPAR